MKLQTAGRAYLRQRGNAFYQSIKSIQVGLDDWTIKFATVTVFLGLGATMLVSRPPVFANIVELADFELSIGQSSIEEVSQPEFTTPLIVEVEDLEIPRVEEMFDYYSFEYTSLGFGLKDLSVLQDTPRFETEQKLFNLVPSHLQSRAKSYIRPVLKLCEKHQIDPFWVLSVMWTESHFKYSAKSHVGANGLMQLMPETRKWIYRSMKKRGIKLEVEEGNFHLANYFEHIPRGGYKTYVRKLVNIEIGIIYLKQLLKQFNYNHRLATVAYNMGPGWTVRRLRRNQPVGTKNLYLDKVTKAYTYFIKQIKS
jgi:hypothetical protein